MYSYTIQHWGTQANHFGVLITTIQWIKLNMCFLVCHRAIFVSFKYSIYCIVIWKIKFCFFFWLQGKDAILYAVASLCSSCHDAISNEDAATPNAILGLISSACTKKVKSYREAAFSSLKQVNCFCNEFSVDILANVDGIWIY